MNKRLLLKIRRKKGVVVDRRRNPHWQTIEHNAELFVILFVVVAVLIAIILEVTYG